jgi:hypothetical protein
MKCIWVFGIAAVLLSYGLSAAENCNKIQSDVLRIVDVQPYVGKICGKDYEVLGIYQEPQRVHSAVVYYRCGSTNSTLKLVRFDSGAGFGWFDADRFKFVCR